MILQKYILLTSLLFSGFLIQAGVGGAGGGADQAGLKYTEIRVCIGADDSQSAECSLVRLKTSKYLEQQVALQKGVSAQCFKVLGEIEVRVPCNKKFEEGVSVFLQKGNDTFNNGHDNTGYSQDQELYGN